MTQGWTLRDKNKPTDYYAWYTDADEGPGYMPVDHPTLIDRDEADGHAKQYRHYLDHWQKVRNLQLEAVEIQYTVIEK